MKKFLSCFIALLMIISGFAVMASAADSYTKAHAITVAEESAKKIQLIPVEFPVEKDENGNPVFVPLDTSYVADGSDFHFILVCKGQYAFDQTTRVKVFPTSKYLDIIEGVEYEDYSTETNDQVKYKTSTGYGIIEPDADGVYTIPAVAQDSCIYLYNYQEESIASVKDFLLNFYRFFLQLINWFFGLGQKIGF